MNRGWHFLRDAGVTGKFLEWAQPYSTAYKSTGYYGHAFRSLPHTGLIPLVDDDTIRTKYYTFIMICVCSIGYIRYQTSPNWPIARARQLLKTDDQFRVPGQGARERVQTLGYSLVWIHAKAKLLLSSWYTMPM